MKIEHIALWVHDIDNVCEFYKKYFDAKIGNLYINKSKGFRSRFIEFEKRIPIRNYEPRQSKTFNI